MHDGETSGRRIAIVGAGIRGLASAAYLKRHGYAVRVFDTADEFGGIWRKVYPSSVINTPSYGYTFHHTNLWQHLHPSRDEILENIERLVAVESLRDDITLGTPVGRVVYTPPGQWRVNEESQIYDGMLVCTGFLGEGKTPDAASVQDYDGRVVLPYDFDPTLLRDKSVAVVGSGSTALEMLALAHQHGCRRATLILRPGTDVRESGRMVDAKFWISSNPFLYALTKRRGGGAAAVAPDITPVLDSDSIDTVEGEFASASGRLARLEDGRAYEADVLVWCTGWSSPTPDWVRENKHHATLVTAMCPRCLDTAGFGFGASTIHAKLLDLILRQGITEPFNPSSYGCDCESDPCRHGPHIIGSAIRYIAGRPGGLRSLGRLLAQGARSNVLRLRQTEEPTWVGLVSFLNAPFGL